MKINEIFKGIQGEGKYCGVKMLFIRLSGCTRNCKWCDTSYHKQGKEMTIIEVCEKIIDYNYKNINNICFTGGEPLLQIKEMNKIIDKLPRFDYYLETNGDLIKGLGEFYRFKHLSISPKDLKTAKKIDEMREDWKLFKKFTEIKVVTDLKSVGMEMLKYATMLMPLTTYNEKKDMDIKRKVWNYCMEHNLRYSPRLQVDLWGKERKK